MLKLRQKIKKILLQVLPIFIFALSLELGKSQIVFVNSCLNK